MSPTFLVALADFTDSSVRTTGQWVGRWGGSGGKWDEALFSQGLQGTGADRYGHEHNTGAEWRGEGRRVLEATEAASRRNPDATS